jgi:hypothetical protein
MRAARGAASLSLLLLLAGGIPACPSVPPPPPSGLEPGGEAFRPLERQVSYEADVAPLLESRCAVCHACNDAPCQLLFTSFEGAQRGATKEPVYDAARLRAKAPTRMFIDAHGTPEWRAREFFSVLDAPAPAGDPPAVTQPLLLDMLALGRAHALPQGQRLPAEVPLDIDRKLSCPTASEFGAYAREHPLGGMPYAVAPLQTEEIRILASWVGQSPPPPAPAAIPARAQAQVALWESFLNGGSRKQRIAARYLYEHWFLAHLAFDEFPGGPFFEAVRSRTPPGEPIDLIASVRPYDDPGVERPWYRLRPVASAIARKTHIVYPLGDAKLRRLRELFLDSDWQPTRLPGYTPEEASNPFIAFAEIPAKSRYAFLLDDAEYFVMTFIRGPVCRGQVAVDVIEDQFWIAFVDPARDLSVLDPRFLAKAKKLLALPAEHAGELVPGSLWLEYNLLQREYLEMRVSAYDALDPQHRGPALDWIWDGDRSNRNALLTVFRNFDNATVVKGFVGEIPKTAWIIDYPIFERIYYNLVAGFDIFGNVAHQVSTRLYMDHLRMQSENLFLAFLPADRREAIRDSWYEGATRQLSYAVTDKLRALDHGTQIRFTTPDPKAELLEKILAQAGAAAGPPDTLNRCPQPPCDRPGASAVERSVEHELQRIASRKGAFVALLPEVSLLRVRVEPRQGTHDLVYALVHNAAHTNVAFMFGEDERRIPADDTLTVVRGHFGSYPNFFFEAQAEAIRPFVDELAALGSESDLERFVGRYGIRRTSARFWEISDWLRADLQRRDPREAGIYDLNRYGNL